MADGLADGEEVARGRDRVLAGWPTSEGGRRRSDRLDFAASKLALAVLRDDADAAAHSVLVDACNYFLWLSVQRSLPPVTARHPADLAWPRAAARNAEASERRTQADLIRDIFGNPFRPVTLNPSWLTSTVVPLARQMYDTRDFSAMPILADALQDAGCNNPDILDHCRGEGPHVRGCWVVDLVLGKR
jgi:hypothetical protein